ncbi:hypothetical protein L3X38_033958 [Prunus dulcis]|uniref:Uncharacterized protein n=1 Tax=Prunus dulcis TaxID=3755 RepID=A0AAD4VGX4_PRUDU|nr:hypothetical protein L3X38_033958 [Prunus dulcis]
MNTLGQLRNRRVTGLEGQLRGVGVCTGPEGQLRGIGAYIDGSSARKKEKRKEKKGCEHLGSVEKQKVHRSGRTAQGYWGPRGRLKRKKKKKVTDTLDQLRNQRPTGSEGQLKGIGVRLGSVSKKKQRSMRPTRSAEA